MSEEPAIVERGRREQEIALEHVVFERRAVRVRGEERLEHGRIRGAGHDDESEDDERTSLDAHAHVDRPMIERRRHADETTTLASRRPSRASSFTYELRDETIATGS